MFDVDETILLAGELVVQLLPPGLFPSSNIKVLSPIQYRIDALSDWNASVIQAFAWGWASRGVIDNQQPDYYELSLV